MYKTLLFSLFTGFAVALTACGSGGGGHSPSENDNYTQDEYYNDCEGLENAENRLVTYGYDFNWDRQHQIQWQRRNSNNRQVREALQVYVDVTNAFVIKYDNDRGRRFHGRQRRDGRFADNDFQQMHGRIKNAQQNLRNWR